MGQHALELNLKSLLGFRLLDADRVGDSIRLGSKISTKGGMKPNSAQMKLGSKVGAKPGVKPDVNA